LVGAQMMEDMWSVWLSVSCVWKTSIKGLSSCEHVIIVSRGIRVQNQIDYQCRWLSWIIWETIIAHRTVWTAPCGGVDWRAWLVQLSQHPAMYQTLSSFVTMSVQWAETVLMGQVKRHLPKINLWWLRGVWAVSIYFFSVFEVLIYFCSGFSTRAVKPRGFKSKRSVPDSEDVPDGILFRQLSMELSLFRGRKNFCRRFSNIACFCSAW